MLDPIAFLLAQHEAEQAQREAAIIDRVIVRNSASKAHSASKGHAKAPSTETTVTTGRMNAPKNVAPVQALPVPGTLDATAFIKAIRKAATRDEQVKAIAGYTGWNPALDFGTQDSNARTKAMNEIRGVKVGGMTRDEQRSAARSMTGYVAGMPSMRQRTIAELLARETAVIDTLIQCEKASRDMSLSQDQQAENMRDIQIARERLNSIRSMLSQYGR